jgi:hypothetical protein
VFRELLKDHRYREVTEVGISFNRACDFTYAWAAPSNEGRPGVHIALGGDADPDHSAASRLAGMVHVDLMAATTKVEVNRRVFMTTTSTHGVNH